MCEERAGRFRLILPSTESGKAIPLWNLRRLVRAKRTCSITDELGLLAGMGLTLTAEDAYDLIRQIEDASDAAGFFVLDGARNPEEWEGRDADLPTCVLETAEAMYIDYNDMPRILALDTGANIPDYVPDAERQARRRRQQARPVLSAMCREEGCCERIVINVGMAARAIRGHRLIEKGDMYEPSTLCRKHRDARDVRLAEKRSSAGGRLTASVSDHVSAKGKARGAEKAAKGRERKAAAKAAAKSETTNATQEATQEASYVDQNVAVADAVPEVTSALPATQPEAASAAT